ncbi:MAG TPA: hypothetical protein VFJ59_09415, partial [Pseudolabrys sp.]|nr:hypothetical protein [Pseudolabrys sp.]
MTKFRDQPRRAIDACVDQALRLVPGDLALDVRDMGPRPRFDKKAQASTAAATLSRAEEKV